MFLIQSNLESVFIDLQPEAEILRHQSKSDAYSSVGGLEKQIAEIRDLLEIPLIRPELFRYFGK